DAFFVHVPSNHNYYLPQNSNEWEFLYFSIYGEEANRLFYKITNSYGYIFKLTNYSEPIKHILETIEKIETTGINNSYVASASVYKFIMKFLEYLEYGYQKKIIILFLLLKQFNLLKKIIKKILL